MPMTSQNYLDVRDSDFYIAPDFLSSHDLGMLAKKLQIKSLSLFLSWEDKYKIVKDRKKETYTSLKISDLKMCKEVSKPFNRKLSGLRWPADYNSPHIQASQQFITKDLLY